MRQPRPPTTFPNARKKSFFLSLLGAPEPFLCGPKRDKIIIIIIRNDLVWTPVDIRSPSVLQEEHSVDPSHRWKSESYRKVSNLLKISQSLTRTSQTEVPVLF